MPDSTQLTKPRVHRPPSRRPVRVDESPPRDLQPNIASSNQTPTSRGWSFARQRSGPADGEKVHGVATEFHGTSPHSVASDERQPGHVVKDLGSTAYSPTFRGTRDYPCDGGEDQGLARPWGEKTPPNRNSFTLARLCRGKSGLCGRSRRLTNVVLGNMVKALSFSKGHYLKVENEILRSKLPRRVSLTAQEKNRLVKFSAKLGKAISEPCSCIIIAAEAQDDRLFCDGFHALKWCV